MSSWPRAGGGRTPCPEPPPPPPPAPPATRRRRTGPAASLPRGGCPGHAATMLIRHGAAPHARSKPFPYAKIPTLFSACASLLHFPSSLPGRAAGAPLGTKPMAGANQPGSWIIQPSGSHSSTPSTHLFFLARTALFLREHESCALKCKKLSLTQLTGFIPFSFLLAGPCRWRPTGHKADGRRKPAWFLDYTAFWIPQFHAQHAPFFPRPHCPVSKGARIVCFKV